MTSKKALAAFLFLGCASASVSQPPASRATSSQQALHSQAPASRPMSSRQQELLTIAGFSRERDIPSASGGIDYNRHLSFWIPLLHDCAAAVDSALDKWVQERQLVVLKRSVVSSRATMHFYDQKNPQVFVAVDYEIYKADAHITAFVVDSKGDEQEPFSILTPEDTKSLTGILARAIACP